VTGIAMPGGEPGVLEQLAARLEAIAEGIADLGASTRMVTASIRSDATWTGDAADAYTAFTGNLAQGVVAAPAPLTKIALAVRDYAGCLRTAQEKVAAYMSAAEVAQVSGHDGGYVSAAETAAQIAGAAVTACQAAGDRAAAAVNASGAQLQPGDLFGSQGPVTSWLARQPLPSDALAGFPGLGDPAGPQILKTPVGDPGPQIWVTPVGDAGPLIWVTPVGDIGLQILKNPPGDPGPQIWVTPGGEHGPLINYDTQDPKSKAEIDEQAALLGYPKKIPPPKAPFNSHGMPVYFNGKQYLTPDRDSHNVDNGWKTFSRRGNRTGTWNWDLTERVNN
jgi:uncharacterized protein YukE